MDIDYIIIIIEDKDFNKFDHLEEGKWFPDNQTGLWYRKNPPKPQMNLPGNIHISQKKHINSLSMQVSWNDPDGYIHDRHRFNHNFIKMSAAKDLARRILSVGDDVEFEEGRSLAERLLSNLSKFDELDDRIDTILLRLVFN